MRPLPSGAREGEPGRQCVVHRPDCHRHGGRAARPSVGDQGVRRSPPALVAPVQEGKLDHERRPRPGRRAARRAPSSPSPCRRSRARRRGRSRATPCRARPRAPAGCRCRTRARTSPRPSPTAACPACGRARSRSRAGPRGAAEDEPSRLGAEDHVRLERPGDRLEPVDRLLEVDGVGDERHQVLEDDPRLGKSGTSRTLSRRSRAAPGVLTGRLYLSGQEPQLRQKRRRDSSCEVSASACRSSRPDLRRSALRGEARGDQLLEQPGLATRRVAEGAQVTGVDAVLREPGRTRPRCRRHPRDRASRPPRSAASAVRTPRARGPGRRRSRPARRARGRPRPRARRGRADAFACGRRPVASPAPGGSRGAAGTRPAAAGGSSPAARRPPR